MGLKNILIVVTDIERSKAFYKEIFGLDVIRDFGENVILTEGLVLQEKNSWESCIDKNIYFGGHNAVLYFEEMDMDSLLEKLKRSSQQVEYVNLPMELDGGQRMVRIYDPDKHIIEIRTPYKYF